ncbi:hypothetical protein [Streptomyces sp. MNP-20]|uniref:hypothetical protein n=1 Tax=Streptomyces sp. MNP-20 TaxID=2721165 RepID=UPI0015572AE2|nr:hypothetical protein [Streptomyces sp. MNP-20]
MDTRNLFETRTTYRLLRLEYGLGLIVTAAAFIDHISEVRWIPAIILFAYIDVIGYLPGLITYHRTPGRHVPKVYYVLYNTMHSLAVQGLVVLAWIWWLGFEWALLVVPLHLFGDRALLGNFLKPFAVSFEPKAHPAYTGLRQALETSSKATGEHRQPEVAA